RLVEQPEGVVSGEDDLLDGELQPGHDYFSFADRVPTKRVARPMPAVNSSTSSTPSGATSRHPFILPRPVIWNSLAWASLSALSPCAGRSRTSTESLLAPTSKLPFSKKPTPLSLFFSSKFLRQVSRCRMHRASSWRKVIGAPNPHFSPVN